MKMLDRLNLPEDIKKLSLDELKVLSEDLREVITEYTLKNGGHLASNLGVVDISCALSYVFDFPFDKIIFDVGHQCYAYKILTGRLPQFAHLRQKGGLNGFPKREESKYDFANSGHASTALSIACGMARGGEKGEVICLIGDGAMTGGLFYEALNDVLTLNKKVIVIINDNDMSISGNVGFVNKYLHFVRLYGEDIPFVEADILTNIDGHNIPDLVGKLKYAKNSKKTVVLHVVTKKGKGYKDAEDNPSKYHSISGEKKSQALSYGQVFGNKIVDLAQKNDKIFAVTAAMTDGTGLCAFAQKFPERFVDVGIAEEHAVTMSSGLSLSGNLPYVAIYSTFLQRAYDNILHDITLNNLPCVFCIDRAGFVGGDGETHQGLYDVAYLGSMPNMSIFMPKDGKELEDVLEYSQNVNKPFAIRYPKSEISGKYNVHSPIEYGKWEYIKESRADTVLISNGETLCSAVLAAEKLEKQGIKTDIINARFIKPIDYETADKIKDKKIFVFEEYIEDNSVYIQLLEYYNKLGLNAKLYGKNIQNNPYAVATRDELLQMSGLDADGIAKFVSDNIK